MEEVGRIFRGDSNKCEIDLNLIAGRRVIFLDG